MLPYLTGTKTGRTGCSPIPKICYVKLVQLIYHFYLSIIHAVLVQPQGWSGDDGLPYPVQHSAGGDGGRDESPGDRLAWNISTIRKCLFKKVLRTGTVEVLFIGNCSFMFPLMTD